MVNAILIFYRFRRWYGQIMASTVFVRIDGIQTSLEGRRGFIVNASGGHPFRFAMVVVNNLLSGTVHTRLNGACCPLGNPVLPPRQDQILSIIAAAVARHRRVSATPSAETEPHHRGQCS
jgi:hypothetical protein